MHQIPLYDHQMVVERLSVVFYRSATGRRWFSVVCDQSFTVRDCHTMVFSILAQTLGVRLVRDQSVTSHPPVYTQYKLEGSPKTCRRTVSDSSPMGGDLCAMVGDSPTISADLLLTNCGPPVVRPVLH